LIAHHRRKAKYRWLMTGEDFIFVAKEEWIIVRHTE
jgi:hypothetical protein